MNVEFPDWKSWFTDHATHNAKNASEYEAHLAAAEWTLSSGLDINRREDFASDQHRVAVWTRADLATNLAAGAAPEGESGAGRVYENRDSEHDPGGRQGSYQSGPSRNSISEFSELNPGRYSRLIVGYFEGLCPRP
jgi:hypothetical protein